MEWYYTSKPKDEFQHHGILGQKWGVRRFQNEDGTWTEAGRKRYDPSFEEIESRRRKQNAISQIKAQTVGRVFGAVDNAVVAAGIAFLSGKASMEQAISGIQQFASIGKQWLSKMGIL